MSHGIYSALSGALAQSAVLETTAGNLANTSTVGYRSIRPVFHEVLAKGVAQQRARFATVQRTVTDTSPGIVRATGRALDIALPNQTFLAVQTPAGERYTRAGALHVSSEGLLVTRNGEPFLDENLEKIETGVDGEVTIAEDGSVLSDGMPVGFLRLVTFDDPSQLERQGAQLLLAGPTTGEPRPSSDRLEVGQLEESNATPVRAMTELMMATRMFEAMERAISAFHAIDQRLVTTVPK